MWFTRILNRTPFVFSTYYFLKNLWSCCTLFGQWALLYFSAYLFFFFTDPYRTQISSYPVSKDIYLHTIFKTVFFMDLTIVPLIIPPNLWPHFINWYRAGHLAFLCFKWFFIFISVYICLWTLLQWGRNYFIKSCTSSYFEMKFALG